MLLWNRSLKNLSLLLILLNFSGLSYSQKNKNTTVVSLCRKNIKEGIRGKIIMQMGNQMPSPGSPPKISNGVARTIGIFALTRLEDTEAGQKIGFYKKIKTKRIAQIKSRKDGCFAIKLPPGRYSLFVREKGEWYANSFGGEGEIFEIVIKSNEITETEFRINHSAYF